jgi:chromosome partitioning protein
MFVISLYNLKGGVGKTAAAVNLAYMAARDGYRTLLWDLDPQGAASFYFGAEASVKGQAKKIIESQVSLQSVIQPAGYEGLHIIPADLSARKLDVLLEEHQLSKKLLRNLLKPMADYFDFVFIDCPPGFSSLADNIFFVSDAVLMPVIPTTLSTRTYDIVYRYFQDKEISLDKLMCFFSMVDKRKSMHGEVMEKLLKDNRFFEYYIPYMSQVEKMGVHQAPVEAFAPSGPAAVCYRALWGEIKEGVLE